MAPLIDKHRLGGLQDAVYGVALTLLVLELRLPELGPGATDAAIRHALVELLPRLLSWLLSFGVIAVVWSADAALLRALPAVDRMLLRLSLVQLALISLLPFSSALIGAHGNRPTAAAVYALHIAAINAVSAWRWTRLARAGAAQADPAVEAGVRRHRPRAALGLGCALCAAALAPVAPGYNMLALLPMALGPLGSRVRQDRGSER